MARPFNERRKELAQDLCNLALFIAQGEGDPLFLAGELERYMNICMDHVKEEKVKKFKVSTKVRLISDFRYKNKILKAGSVGTIVGGLLYGTYTISFKEGEFWVPPNDLVKA